MSCLCANTKSLQHAVPALQFAICWRIAGCAIGCKGGGVYIVYVYACVQMECAVSVGFELQSMCALKHFNLTGKARTANLIWMCQDHFIRLAK